MSSRQLRKLQQQQALEQTKLPVPHEDEESEEEPVVAQKSKPSLFASLAALEDEADDDGAEEEEELPVQESSAPEPAPASATKKAKKSKKKKTRRKANDKANTQGDSENGDDEIEAALRDLNMKEVANGKSIQAASLDSEYERVCTLLGINTNHLKVANEMKSLFGKEALENLDDAGGPVGRGARGRQRAQPRTVDLETALKGHHAPGKGLAELTLRRNYLIQGKEHWPKSTTGGLTMEMVDDKSPDGSIEFRYVHDKNYQELQQTFYGLVEMGDPQNMIGMLTRYPYHISLLIQVSKIAKDQGDNALSADLLERALFSFGRAATSAFNTKLSQGKARLDFARPENRELWLAGYHYIKTLIQKGTYRTALEWAKLLLSLSPEEDPYCTYLVIHDLAIRAHDFQWLLDFSESASTTICDTSKEAHREPVIYFRPSLTLAAVQVKDPTKARQTLSQAMLNVPWVFTRLFKELNLDAPKTIWGLMPRTDAETLFTEIYIMQTKDLWNTPELTALLMEVAHTINKPDLDSIPLLDNTEMTLDVVRHVYLDNKPQLMAMVPGKLLHRSNNSDSDPLPPDQNIFSYAVQRMALQTTDRSAGVGNNFHNPLAAIAQLLNGGGQLPAAPIGMDEISEAMRREMALEFGEGREDLENDSDDGGDMVVEDSEGNRVPLSLARRLLNFFQGARHDDDDGAEEDAEEEEEKEDEDTDTDNDMPPLIALEGENESRRVTLRQATVEDTHESDS